MGGDSYRAALSLPFRQISIMFMKNSIFQLAGWFSEGINEMYYELVPSPDAFFFVIFNNPV